MSSTAIFPTNRWVRYVLGLVHQLLGAGIVFGWPAMQRILQRENIYGELCPGILVSKCDEATIKYNAIFNAGSFGSTGGALLFGIFFDKFGPRSSSVLGHATLLLGLLLFAFSSNDLDMFLPAYLFIGLAGSTIQLAVLPVCNEFKHPSIFLTTYSAIYAGSALIFTVFEMVSKSGGYGHKSIFLVYSGIVFVSFCVGFVLIPKQVNHADKDRNHETEVPDSPTVAAPPREDSKMSLDTAVVNMATDDEGDQGDNDEGEQELLTQEFKGNKPVASLPKTIGEQLMAANFKGQVFNRVFAVPTFFTMIHNLRINYYVGTAEKQLDRFGDNGHYLDVFSDLLPFGALFVLATGPAFHYFGLFKTMFLFEVLSLFYMVPVLIRSLPLQYVTFLVVCCLRPFQFAVMFNSINMLFGSKYFGTLLGIISTMGGLFSLLQTPLLSITLDYCDGNFAPVNIALLVAGSPLLLLPWYLDRYLKRPADARNNPKHETELALRQPLSPREELSITVALRKDDGLGTPPPVVGRNPSSFGNTRRRVTSAEGKNRQFAHGEFEELSEGEE